MRDKRPVDELSIEELERILAIKKREARQQQLQRMKRDGRLVDDPKTVKATAEKERVTQPPAPKPTPAATPIAAMPVVPMPIAEEIPAAPAKTESNGAQHLPTPAKIASPPPIRPAVRFEDDPYDIDDPAPKRNNDRVWKLFVDRSLLLVEIAAVVGLVYVAVNLFGAIGNLQRETATAQQLADEQRMASLPTIAPTPTIRLQDVVLPGGHIITESGATQFNVSEIPAHLQARVQAEILTPVISRPPRTPETALEVDLPSIRVEQTIVQGTDWDALRLGVGQTLNGVSPADDTGNVVLAAHNDIYGETFRDLQDMEIGDIFYIRTETEIYEYVVVRTEIVAPTDVWVMDNVPGKATATLITCHPYGVNTQRFIVFAERRTT